LDGESALGEGLGEVMGSSSKQGQGTRKGGGGGTVVCSVSMVLLGGLVEKRESFGGGFCV